MCSRRGTLPLKRISPVQIATVVVLTGVIAYVVVSHFSGARRILGSAAATIIVDARTSESFRLAHVQRLPISGKIEDFPVVSKGRVLGQDLTSRLTRVLLDPHTYVTDTRHGLRSCIFDPIVAFRLSRGHSDVEILVCFHCNQMAITTIDDSARTSTVYTEFDRVRPALVSVVKMAFPGDEEIDRLR